MNSKKDGIPFNGFHSVLEMLRRSDSVFRNKLLLNLRRKDPQLAQRLESELREWVARDQGSLALERGTRAAQARTYGN
jgi:hypothetical protein